MSSIGKTFSHELQLFGQICTPQEGTQIGRNAFTLHSAASHYTHHFEFVLVEILTLDVVVDLPHLLLTGRQITARRFLRPVDHPYSHGHSDVPPEYMATNRNMALVKKEYPPSEQH